jgi:hypothetical protein
MTEEKKEAKPKKRMTATQAAASIGPMVKEFITGTIRARAEGKQKIAYTFIVCHHEEIFPGFAGQREMRKDSFKGRNQWAFPAPYAPMPFAGSVLTNGEKNWVKCRPMLHGADRQDLTS